MQHTPTAPTAATARAIQLGRWADRNLFNFAHLARTEIDRATDRDAEIALAAVGIAICRARATIRAAVDQIEQEASP